MCFIKWPHKLINNGLVTLNWMKKKTRIIKQKSVLKPFLKYRSRSCLDGRSSTWCGHCLLPKPRLVKKAWPSSPEAIVSQLPNIKKGKFGVTYISRRLLLLSNNKIHRFCFIFLLKIICLVKIQLKLKAKRPINEFQQNYKKKYLYIMSLHLRISNLYLNLNNSISLLFFIRCN